MKAQDILDFWFTEITPKQWFSVEASFDTTIRERFSATHQQATLGELYTWRATPAGRLAEVIVLDQFSRNMYRGTAQAFAFDAIALVLAQEAVALGADQELPSSQRPFLFMPYMHSESARIHEVAVTLFQAPGMENNLDFEHRHKAIIDRFGRYPHRNEILGRTSTPEEQEFLEKPGSSF